MSVAVEFADGVAVEIEPFRIFGRAGIPALVQLKPALAALHHGVHLLPELLLLVGVYAHGEGFEGEALLGQNVAIAVGEQVALDVVLHHDEITHVQGLDHHFVEF